MSNRNHLCGPDCRICFGGMAVIEYDAKTGRPIYAKDIDAYAIVERAAIREYDGGMSRERSEFLTDMEFSFTDSAVLVARMALDGDMECASRLEVDYARMKAKRNAELTVAPRVLRQ